MTRTPAPNPKCCSDPTALCETCWSKLAKNSNLRNHQPVPAFVAGVQTLNAKGDIPMSELVLNNPTMNCCGRPRSQCVCRNHATEHLQEVEAMAPKPSVVFNHNPAGDDGIDYSGAIPRLDFHALAANARSKAEGSNADANEPGEIDAGGSQKRYWEPSRTHKSGQSGETLIDALEERDRMNQKRLGLGTERGGREEDQDVLGLPNMDEFIEGEVRRERTARLARQQQDGR